MILILAGDISASREKNVGHLKQHTASHTRILDLENKMDYFYYKIFKSHKKV